MHLITAAPGLQLHSRNRKKNAILLQISESTLIFPHAYHLSFLPQCPPVGNQWQPLEILPCLSWVVISTALLTGSEANCGLVGLTSSCMTAPTVSLCSHPLVGLQKHLASVDECHGCNGSKISPGLPFRVFYFHLGSMCL